jgi:hypothetical protein
MVTQAVARQPLNLVLAPDSPAEAALRTTERAPGFEADPTLNLHNFGGSTIPHLTFVNVYLGLWQPQDCTTLNAAIAAAMSDTGLNNVLAQYFPGTDVSSRFAGSRTVADDRMSFDQPVIEELVAKLYADGVLAGYDRQSTAMCILLPPGAVLYHGSVSSEHGLGGYHGSVHAGRAGMQPETVYYGVSVYSEGTNGITSFPHPWQNICATIYHELQEIRTDPNVEDAIRGKATPGWERLLGWYSPRGGEIGDIALVMTEVALADGSGNVPVQLMWSNAVAGPEGPISLPHSLR